MKKTLLAALIIVNCFQLFSQTKSKEEISKQFLDDLKKSQYESALKLCDTSFTNKMDAERLRQSWEGLEEQLGDFKECIGMETKSSGEYEATFQAFKFVLGTFDFQLTFNSRNLIVGMFMVPHVSKNLYQLPAYVKQEMVFETKLEVKTGKFVLPAILTTPKTGDKFPVVILVHGSGPGDKDESVGPNKPFEDLAYGLANKGIAVLRYDKRTHVYGAQSVEDINSFTVKEEVLDDVSSAIQLVKGKQEIDTNNIYLIGHSLGGELAPRIAKLHPDLKGIVIMAGPARSSEDISLEQNIYLAKLEGNSQQTQKELDTLKSTLNELKHNNFSDQKVKMFVKKSGLPESYWKDENDYHQVDVAKSLNCKILVLQGGTDFQVSMKDFDIWKGALSNKKNAEFHSCPKLNHLFMEGEGKTGTAEYDIPKNIPEYVVNDIAKWMKDN